MATSANKSPAKGDAKTEAPAPKSKKKLIMIILIALIVLGGGGGGAAWYFMHKGAADSHKEAKVEPPKPPIFISLESFTVNLQPEDGEKYLQIALTLQVAEQTQMDLIKLHMPQVRSRLLTLFSSRKASEILTAEGKEALSKDIIKQVNEPFIPKGTPQNVSGVFFTSFIVQ